VGKRAGPSRAELKEAKQAELEYASAVQQRRMSRERLRKAEDHRKFRNGGMIQQVGLHELPSDLLLGGLLLLKRFLEKPDFKAEALKRGKKTLADLAAKKQARKVPELIVAFDLAPPVQLLATLKSLGMTFNRRRKEWRGLVDRHGLARAIRASDWENHVDRIDYAEPLRDPGE
jgi:hypothetical protein